MASAGGIDADGWAFRVSNVVEPAPQGLDRLQHHATRGGRAAATSPASQRSTRPIAWRPETEDIHDITTSLETDIPETATRVFVVYKVNTGFARVDQTQPGPGLDGRFDVQLNQALPFDFAGTRWEVLVGVRNLFRDPTDPGLGLRRTARRPAAEAGGRRLPRPLLSSEPPRRGVRLFWIPIPVTWKPAVSIGRKPLVAQYFRVAPRRKVRGTAPCFADARTSVLPTLFHSHRRVNVRSAVLRTTAQCGRGRVLLCLGIMNISVRATWTEMDDGAAVASGRHRGRRDGSRRGFAGGAGRGAGGRHPPGHRRPPGRSRPDDVVKALHAAARGSLLTYSVLRMQGAPQLLDIAVEQIPSGAGGLYYALAVVGIFSLLVGASVRLRRPRSSGDAALLLADGRLLRRAGVLVQRPARRARLDLLLGRHRPRCCCCRRCSCTSRSCFPERPERWVRSDAGRAHAAAALPAGRCCSAAPRSRRCCAAASQGAVLSRLVDAASSAASCSTSRSACVGGLAIMIRALRRGCSVTARRQLRWIVWGTALGAVPFVVRLRRCRSRSGCTPLRGFEFTRRPARPGAARLRLGDRPLPPDGRRGDHQARAGLRGGAGGDRGDLRDPAAGSPARCFLHGAEQRNPVIALLATLVVVLLSRPVKNAIQNAPRPRLLPRSLRLPPRARRLRARPEQRSRPAAAQRAAASTASPKRSSSIAWRCCWRRSRRARGDFVTIAHTGFGRRAAVAARSTPRSRTRLIAGHTLTLDDPLAQRRLEHARGGFLARRRDPLLRAVRLEGRDDRGDGARPQGEHRAAEQRGHGAARRRSRRRRRRRSRTAGSIGQLRVKADELERMRAVQREHPRVAERRPRRRQPRRSRRALEPAAGGALRRCATRRRSGRPLDRHCSTTGSSRCCGARAASRRTARRSTACRCTTRHAPPRSLLVNVATTPLRDSHAAIAGTIVIIEDISARVQLEEQLQISEKMASIGLLAAGVAHEVNTPLTGISSFTQMLLERRRAGRSEDRGAREDRAADVPRRARSSTACSTWRGRRRSTAARVDLNAVINDVLSLLEHQFRTGSIQVRKELAATRAGRAGRSSTSCSRCS